MKNTSLKALLLSVALAALTAQSALAAGTPACTSIANTATVNFSVGNVPDPTGASASAAPFIVGNKVIPVVAVQDASPGVTAIHGASNTVLEFTVTNDGNKVQDYALSTVNLATGQTAWAGITDEFDAGAATAYVESGDAAGYDALDIETFIDELAPDDTVTVYVVVAGPVPTTASNDDNALYALVATTHRGGTAGGAIGALVLNGETGACSEDTVFADLATSTGPNDANLDGKDSDRSGLVVSASATVEVDKSSAVYSDPINGIGAGAKAIPGAVVTYTILITNPGTSTATVSGVTIADSLDAQITAGNIIFNTLFDDGNDTCAAGQGIVVDNNCLTNTTGDDAADFTANVVNATGANLAPGASTEIKFQVTVQ